MQFLLSVIVLFIFAAIWYLPIVKKQQAISGIISRKDLRKAFLMGLIPATIVILVVEIAFGWILKLAHITDDMLIYHILSAFIMYGLVEELVKYFCAGYVMKKNTSLCRVDIMVVFAAVGLGYEVTETIFYGNMVASIIRGVFVAHMMYQLVMAHFYCESLRARDAGNEGKAKKMSVCALVVPIIIHGFNDLGCQLISYRGFDIDETIQTIICILFVLILQLITAIVGIILSKKNQDLSLSISGENI